MRLSSLILAVVTLASQVACSRPEPPSPAVAQATAVAAPASQAPSAATLAAHPWSGTWNGPEGTSLLVEGGGAQVRLTIHDLDGPRKYAGRVDGPVIRFERDGVVESISAGNGEQTGMKWLADEKNCLLVKEGEGWCRR